MCHKTLTSCFIWLQWFLYLPFWLTLHTVQYIYGVIRCDFLHFTEWVNLFACICFLSENSKSYQTKVLSSISDSKLWVYIKLRSKPSVPGMREGHIYILMYLQTHLCETFTTATSWKMPFFSLYKIRHVNSHLETQVV